MNNIRVAVIINSFNRLSLLKLAIDALSKWVPNSEFNQSIAVVIFDAGSSDGTIDWINSKMHKLPFQVELLAPENLADKSFAAGLNYGVFYSLNQFPNVEYLLFYETDNQILASSALKQAIEELKLNNTIGACGFTVRKYNGRSAGVGQAFPSLFNFLLGNQLVHKLRLERSGFKWFKSNSGNSFSYLDVVYTSPLLVKVKAWNDSGGFDEKAFPFSDCDIDWAKRLSNMGWKMGVIKSNDVIHDNMETLSGWSKNRAIHFHRGRLNYFKKHNPKNIYLIWPTPLMIRHLVELLISKLFVKDKNRKIFLSEQFKQLYNTVRNSYF